MITTRQRAFLRGLANTLDPVAQIGKEGITKNVVESIDLLLEARELVKIKVLKNAPTDSKTASRELCESIGCDGVQCIGSIIVLYKHSTRKDIKHIELIWLQMETNDKR